MVIFGKSNFFKKDFFYFLELLIFKLKKKNNVMNLSII